MDDFNKRCQSFLVDSFSPLDYQWTREEFFSLSAKALQSGIGNDFSVNDDGDDDDE